jgi:hypothetical protein
MKKTILFFVVLVTCCLGSKGQEPAKEAPSSEEISKAFVGRISPKLNLTKGQKDTLTLIFLQYMDDIQKYHAETNAKVITFMMKTRDDKVKVLLRDSLKYDKYLMVMEDIKKQREPPPPSMQNQGQGGQRHSTGGGMGGGTGGGMNGGQPY